MSETPDERIRREEREEEAKAFSKAIDDSYKFVRKLALDNNALEDYNRSDSKLENLHLALIIVGEGRATRAHSNATLKFIIDIFTKVSENSLLKAIGVSMVAGFASMVIINVARLLMPNIFS